MFVGNIDAYVSLDFVHPYIDLTAYVDAGGNVILPVKNGSAWRLSDIPLLS
jgi:hypothetical protein